MSTSASFHGVTHSACIASKFSPLDVRARTVPRRNVLAALMAACAVCTTMLVLVLVLVPVSAPAAAAVVLLLFDRCCGGGGDAAARFCAWPTAGACRVEAWSCAGGAFPTGDSTGTDVDVGAEVMPDTGAGISGVG